METVRKPDTEVGHDSLRLPMSLSMAVTLLVAVNVPGLLDDQGLVIIMDVLHLKGVVLSARPLVRAKKTTPLSRTTCIVIPNP